MAIITEHAEGAPCWFELGTSDQASADKFYSGLFGWEVARFPISNDEFYSMYKMGKSDVAAGFTLPPEWGVPPNWGLYFNTSDVDATAAKAKELGGTVMKEPFDVMEFGRMAVLQDPEGAAFSVWQKKLHIGASRMNEPHTVCWVELATRDPEKARGFYTGLFGWETNQSTHMTTYFEFGAGGQHRGGLLQMSEEWGQTPAHWTLYFMTSDVDETAAKAKELGGAVKHEPFDLEGVGRIAVVADPQGVRFYLITLKA